jgi:HK97 family phage portal protein
MAVVSSYGALQLVTPSQPSWAYSGGLIAVQTETGKKALSYAQIYSTVPIVRTCVDFMGNNVAHLGRHIFRRLSDTDRARLTDHELGDWLDHPNTGTTGFGLIQATVIDWALYGNAYWLKVRLRERIGLVRIPPETVHVEGHLLPQLYVVTRADGTELPLAPSEVVHFRMPNPNDPLVGLSPLYTLKNIVAEEFAAGEYRRSFWKNAARIEGVITQDATGPSYSPAQLTEFRAQWQDTYSGASKAGLTPVLPKGMDFKDRSFSAKDSEYTESMKALREIVPQMYGIPLPMVGILDHATFSNIREQHKHLYQDCLGPPIEMLTQEIERQLLPECRDSDRVYLEFNIAAKLAGSFEERAAAMQVAVGRPWRTVNEARAQDNLPRTDDPEDDKVAKPLNMEGRNLPADGIPGGVDE